VFEYHGLCRVALLKQESRQRQAVASVIAHAADDQHGCIGLVALPDPVKAGQSCPFHQFIRWYAFLMDGIAVCVSDLACREYFHKGQRICCYYSKTTK